MVVGKAEASEETAAVGAEELEEMEVDPEEEEEEERAAIRAEELEEMEDEPEEEEAAEEEEAEGDDAFFISVLADLTALEAFFFGIRT